ncbi:MAG: hypothetical protein VXX48_00245 [Pseudomonadota bacterium]|nr:hypothetical protein [Pseudomonadota bacterium]
MKEAPNYTNAFLVMAFVNLVTALIIIWAAFGYLAALRTSTPLYKARPMWQDRHRPQA